MSDYFRLHVKTILFSSHTAYPILQLVFTKINGKVIVICQKKELVKELDEGSPVWFSKFDFCKGRASRAGRPGTQVRR